MKATCISLLYTVHCVPAESWFPTVSHPGTEPLLVPMTPTLVCIMSRFSGSAIATQAGDLVTDFWVLFQHQYNKQHITISNIKPDPEPPPT